MRSEVAENNRLSGKIETNVRSSKTGERVSIDAKEAQQQAKRILDELISKREQIINQLVLSASMTESITGHALRGFVINPKPDSTVELLIGKQDANDWREFGFVGASTEWNDGIKLNVDAQSLVELVSDSSNDSR